MIARLVHLQEHLRTCHDSNTGSLGAKQACAWFKKGLHVFQLHVHLFHMLHPFGVTRSLV